MNYPDSPMDFIKQYSFSDKQRVYTNGAELISVFRIGQMIEHYMSDLTPQQIKDMQFCLKEKSQEVVRLRREIQKLKNKENDGWISVEQELPPLGQRLQATILHHEWISDYDSDWVPKEEKIHHPAYTEVCEIYPIEGLWFFSCREDEYGRDVAYINPIKELGNPISEIIAWRPLPDSYKPGGK